MKQIVIIVLFFVNFLLFLSSVLAENLTIGHEKYIGRKNVNLPVCVLSAFNVTVVVKPANDMFLDTTYANISPETSISQSTLCDINVVKHYYRFNNTEESGRQLLFSIGFEFGSSKSVDMHFKYIEVKCDNPNGCLKDNIKYCSDKDIESLTRKKCLRMSASFSLTWLKEGQTYQCSHNSKQHIKDISYFNESPVFLGSFDIDLHYIRIDATNSTETFNPIKYCLLDWILDTTIIIIVSSIVCLFLLMIVTKCLYDCRRDAKRRKYRTNEETLKWSQEKKCQNEVPNDSDTEKLGPTVDL